MDRPTFSRLSRTFTLASFAAGMAFGLAPEPASANTYAGGREIFLFDDFAGDGGTHPVVIDRATGLYRFARRDGSGAPVWSDTRSTGLPEVASATPGRFRSETTPGFVATHPDANRLAFVAPAPDAVDSHPVLVPSPRPGPARVAAGVFHPDNDGSRDDLALLTAYNADSPGAAAHHLDFVRARTDTAEPLALEILANTAPNLERAGSLRSLRHPAVETDFALLGGDRETLGSLTGYFLRTNTVETGVEYLGSADLRFETAALFASPDAPSLLLWTPGEPLLHHAVVRETGGSPPLEVDMREEACELEAGIEMLFVLEDGSDPARILILHTGGREAAVYPIFDGCPGNPLENISAPEGASLLGAVPDGDGGFTLFSGPARSTSTAFHDYRRESDGSYTLRAEGDLPQLDESLRFPNLIGFDNHPFLVPGSSPFEYYRYKDWTLEGGFDADTVNAVGEEFVSETDGLGLRSEAAVGTAGPQVRFLLPNQVAPDISVAALAPAGSQAPDSVSVTPASGSYNRSVQLTFSTGMPDGEVFYQIGTTDTWNLYEPASPPAVFRDATVRFFARSAAEPARMTAVRSAAYSFAQPFHRFDANGDGVPDFVRAHYGLDPFGHPDTSGNGVTDFEEILRGTDPLDPNDTPQDPPIDFGLVFDANTYPVLPHPEEEPGTVFVGATPGIVLEAHQLQPNRAASAPVGTAPSVVDAPAGARFERLDPAGGRLFFTASSPALFDTDSGDGEWQGHEVIGLFGPPELELPEIDYTPSGLSLADEAEAWRQAALDALGTRERSVVDWELTPESTFTVALMERELARLLAERDGDTGPVAHTLVPHRRGDSDREPFTREKIASLAQPAPGARELDGPLYDLVAGRDAIAGAVTGGGAAHEEAVRRFAAEVYRVRALHYEPQLANLPRPLDVFRHFLENGGVLPEPYPEHVELAASELQAAYDGAGTIANGAFPEKTVEIHFVEIENTTFDAPCRDVTRIETGDTLQLVNDRGETYRFPSALRLPAGTRLEISGFSGASAVTACEGDPFEVLAVHLVFLPTPTGEDDGNLLPDEWEEVYFGEGGVNPFGDANGNGYSNLQHYLEGSDPLAPGPIPGAEPADVSPPTVEIRRTETGDFELLWEYPAEYAGLIDFQFETSPDLIDWTPRQLQNKTEVAPGQWEATIDSPDSNGDTPYYRLRMELN